MPGKPDNPAKKSNGVDNLDNLDGYFQLFTRAGGRERLKIVVTRDT